MERKCFVKEKHVLGIIDWERAMWGEAFMDDSQYQWVKPFFEKAWNEIEKEEKACLK